MTNEDQFAALITGGILRAGGEDIQAQVLDELVQSAGSATLQERIAEGRKLERRPGDFGMEIIGALIVPILVEATTQFWTAYVKRMTEKAGSDLADLSLSSIRKLALRIWRGEEDNANLSELESLVREVARKEGLQPQQIDSLVAKVRDAKVAQQFASG
jgi:hypothetical protein